MTKHEAARLVREANYLTQGHPNPEIFTAIGRYIAALTFPKIPSAEFMLQKSHFKNVPNLPSHHAQIYGDPVELFIEQAAEIRNGLDQKITSDSKDQALAFILRQIIQMDLEYQDRPRFGSLDPKDNHASLLQKMLCGSFSFHPPFLDQLATDLIEKFKMQKDEFDTEFLETKWENNHSRQYFQK